MESFYPATYRHVGPLRYCCRFLYCLCYLDHLAQSPHWNSSVYDHADCLNVWLVWCVEIQTFLHSHDLQGGGLLSLLQYCRNLLLVNVQLEEKD